MVTIIMCLLAGSAHLRVIIHATMDLTACGYLQTIIWWENDVAFLAFGGKWWWINHHWSKSATLYRLYDVFKNDHNLLLRLAFALCIVIECGEANTIQHNLPHECIASQNNLIFDFIRHLLSQLCESCFCLVAFAWAHCCRQLAPLAAYTDIGAEVVLIHRTGWLLLPNQRTTTNRRR